jgi:hypothetical protein
MEIPMMVNSNLIKNMDMVYINLIEEINMMEIGKMI